MLQSIKEELDEEAFATVAPRQKPLVCGQGNRRLNKLMGQTGNIQRPIKRRVPIVTPRRIDEHDNLRGFNNCSTCCPEKAPLSPGHFCWQDAAKCNSSGTEVLINDAVTAPSVAADLSAATRDNKSRSTVGDNKSLPSQVEDYDRQREAFVVNEQPGLDRQEQLEHYFARIRPSTTATSLPLSPYGDEEGELNHHATTVVTSSVTSRDNRSPVIVCCGGGDDKPPWPTSTKAQKVEEMNEKKEKTERNCINWSELGKRYGMREMRERKAATKNRGVLGWRHSCLCNLILSSLQFLFPILNSFKDYTLPGDLMSDLVAGFTIAVLHIPQGMAYGLLAGVEPIDGLYVSFVPVLVMAIMSRSRHVSYGTFAVISMLLANATDNVKLALKRQLMPIQSQLASQLLMGASSAHGISNRSIEGFVMIDNHRPEPMAAQQLLKELLVASQVTAAADTGSGGGSDASMAAEGPALVESLVNDFAMPSNIEILTSLCLVVGLIQTIMALVRLGALSLMFSDQLVSSFTCASAIHVISSQLGSLFDLQLPPVPEGMFRVCRLWWTFLARMAEGTFNPHTAALSLLSILFLISIKEFLEPRLKRRLDGLTCLPSELVLMATLIFASWFWRFNQTYGIHTIGHVPCSLPTPQIPRLELVPLVMQDAATVALVSFAMNLSLAQMYAKRFRYTMNPNQELFALGTSNIVGSFFSCFPCASSLSRSAVQSNLNVRSPICSLFSCAMVISIICYFAHILYDLPRSTLSCIIVVALKGILIQGKDLKNTWHLSKLDAIVWITTFISVIAFDVTYGLVLGILASLVIVFFRLFTPNFSILGRLPGTEIYVDVNCFIDCNEIEQVRIFRFNSALCYLNRSMFKSSIEKCVPSVNQSNLNKLFKDFFCGAKKHLSDSDLEIKFLIIDCSALAYCDYSGASTLVEIIEEFGEKKVTVYLAACPLALANMIEKMGKTKVFKHHMFPTITDAIYQAKYLTRTNRIGTEVDYMTDTCLQSISLTCQPRQPPLLD